MDLDSILFWITMALWLLTPIFIFWEEIQDRRALRTEMEEETEI